MSLLLVVSHHSLAFSQYRHGMGIFIIAYVLPKEKFRPRQKKLNVSLFIALNI